MSQPSKITYHVMSWSELVRKMDYDMSLLAELPFMGYMDGNRKDHQYIIAFDGEVPVGVREFVVKDPSSRNEWLSKFGIPPIQGKIYESWVVSVHPKYRRMGIGTRLNQIAKSLLKEGDIWAFGTHEPDGEKLNQQWIQSHTGPIFTDHAEGYRAYDPTKVNLVLKDRDKRMMRRGALLRLAAQMLPASAERRTLLNWAIDADPWGP